MLLAENFREALGLSVVGAVLICVGGGVLVFLFMMIVGPPKRSHCPNGKPHDYGEWYVKMSRSHTYGPDVENGQERKCKRCGYVQIYKLGDDF